MHKSDNSSWTQRTHVGGLETFSTVDWPGRIVATVFLSGCPWRCAYCHNTHLQKRGCNAGLTWEDVAAQLEKRRGWLDGVVFSGGEPTVDSTLPQQINWVRERRFKVGLHTGGQYPERVLALLPMLNWIGFDLKTSYDGYDALTGVKGSGDNAIQSAHIIATSGIDHEFRLTWHHEVLTEAAALKAASFAKHIGARRFVIQEYHHTGDKNIKLAERSSIPKSLLDGISKLFPDFGVRPSSVNSY